MQKPITYIRKKSEFENRNRREPVAIRKLPTSRFASAASKPADPPRTAA